MSESLPDLSGPAAASAIETSARLVEQIFPPSKNQGAAAGMRECTSRAVLIGIFAGWTLHALRSPEDAIKQLNALPPLPPLTRSEKRKKRYEKIANVLDLVSIVSKSLSR